MIEASYGYLRQFTPDVLRVLSFAGGPAAAALLEAVVGVLAELTASGARIVPADAPTGFAPIRWRGYLDDALAVRRKQCRLPALLGAVRAAVPA